MIDQQDALIYTMVLVSAADRNMTDRELRVIGDIVRHLPVFRRFDEETLTKVTRTCADMLGGKEGLESVLEAIVSSLPERLRETAYALACEVAAADGAANQEELRLLEILRDRLQIDRLVSSAIERGTRARYATA